MQVLVMQNSRTKNSPATIVAGKSCIEIVSASSLARTILIQLAPAAYAAERVLPQSGLTPQSGFC